MGHELSPWHRPHPLELVHPALSTKPVYEAVFALLLGLVLLRLARRALPPGALFALYLLVSGVARILVELLRRNDVIALGLSQAQILSFVSVGAGIFALWNVHRAGR